MASAQLTASSISGRSLPSFEGIRLCSVKLGSAGHVRFGGINQRSFKGLVVKAATVVAPKVFPFLIITHFWVCVYTVCMYEVCSVMQCGVLLP